MVSLKNYLANTIISINFQVTKRYWDFLREIGTENELCLCLSRIPNSKEH